MKLLDLRYGTRWALSGWILLSWAVAEVAIAEVTSHPCMMAVAQGSLEERRARFPEALALFDQARQEPVCQVEAQLGMARTYNSMNDHKDAIAAARWVLANSEDPELQVEAHFEIGRALHKPGRRKTKDKQAAEAAFLQAVELSEGEHRASVRALLRLYEETRQEEKRAEFQERYPEIKASTRARQLKLVTAKKKKGGRGAGEVWMPVEGGSVDCATRAAAPDEDWQLELPRYCEVADDEVPGTRPKKVSAAQPQYTEADRKARVQGVVSFEARIDAEGKVEKVRILEGLSPGLDMGTVAAVCQWTFEPAKDAEGEASGSYLCGAANFALR